MIEPKIMVDDKSLKKALGSLRWNADAVVARAANRTLATANKALSQQVRKKFPKVRAADVKAAMSQRRASVNHPQASLTYISKHRNVYRFGIVYPRSIVHPGERPSPKFYKARVMADHPLVPLTWKPRPFVQRMPNRTGDDMVGLFRRRTEDQLTNYKGKHRRNAIEAVSAPALSQMLKNEEVLTDAELIIADAYLKRLEHDITWELKKGGK